MAVDGPALALQVALVAALKSSDAVFEVVGTRVYGKPPQNVTFPYVQIGSKEVQPVRMSGCAAHWSIMFSVEGHSRPVSGDTEATRIAEAIVAALDEQESAISVAGYGLDWMLLQTQTVGVDKDGRSYTAVVVFEAALSV